MRYGFFKTTISSQDGRDQLTGFQMSGELLGCDAISDSRHVCDAIALEDSEVCPIRFTHLERLSRELPSLQHNLMRMTREDIGSYLGLRLETICRAIAYLRDHSMVRISRRAVEILDLKRLEALIHGCGCGPKTL